MTERLPIPRGNAPYCKCGCGHRTSTVRTEYIYSHRPWKQDIGKRFWSKVEKSPECWNWMAHVHSNGYATFVVDTSRNKKVMAHRYAYETLVGPIPEALTIDHLCKNRRCVNPSHMEVVTRGENSLRGNGLEAALASRRAKADISCRRGHPRTPEHAYRRPDGNWRCKTCKDIARMKRKAALNN